MDGLVGADGGYESSTLQQERQFAYRGVPVMVSGKEGATRQFRAGCGGGARDGAGRERQRRQEQAKGLGHGS
ncbi:hypothetical protein [Oceanithermus sp.]